MANTCSISSDSTGQVFTIKVLDSGTGAPVPGYCSVSISLKDLQQPDGKERAAKFQWFRFKDANNNCAPMRILYLGTAPEPDPGP